MSKPDPRIFTIAQNLGKVIEPDLTPQNVLHVGDNYELDYAAARSVGWKACLVTKKDSGSKDCLQFHTLRDFYEHLQSEGTYIHTYVKFPSNHT